MSVSVIAGNPGFTERMLFINVVGQTVITSLTIIGSTYLLYALMRQGHGKLRVRLLLGMIFGDLLLGYVSCPSVLLLLILSVGAFIPNIWALAGGRFATGTTGCVSHCRAASSRPDAYISGRLWFHLYIYPIFTTSIHASNRHCDVPPSCKPSWIDNG